jgi:pilus assembly protein Flp/PilA
MQQRICSLVSAFVADTRGTTAIEYGIIAAGIAAAIVTVVTTIGDTVNTDLFGKVATAFATVL